SYVLLSPSDQWKALLPTVLKFTCSNLALLFASLAVLATALRSRPRGFLNQPATVVGTMLVSVIALPQMLATIIGGAHFLAPPLTPISAGDEPVLFQHVFFVFAPPYGVMALYLFPLWGFVVDALAPCSRRLDRWRKTSALLMIVTALAVLALFIG